MTVGPGGMEKREGGPHKYIVDVETTAVRPPRGYKYHFALLGGPEFMNDFAKQGERWKQEHRPPLSVVTEHLSPVVEAPGLVTQTGEDARCGLWQACMSSVGVPHVWITISGWSLHSVIMGWFSRDRRSTRLITFRQPGMCLAMS